MEKIIVHGGVFHSDDVMCVAIARIIWPEIKVERVSIVPKGAEEDSETIVADIGGGRFDHHQPDAKRRSDGSKYAACGLLFEELKYRLFPDEKSAEAFENNYIRPIEAADNGVARNPLSCAIGTMNPMFDSDESIDKAFDDAVNMVKGIVEREMKSAIVRKRIEEDVLEVYRRSNRKVVIMDKYLPWQFALVHTDAEYVIYPNKRGTVNIQVVPKAIGSFDAKHDLPKEWLSEKPAGCSFVHDTLFLAVFDDWKSAKEAAENI